MALAAACIAILFWPQSEPAVVKTTFQTAAGWKPVTDVRADGVMVYGVSDNFEERVQSWRDHGYTVQFMTGIAWGSYQDYFTGKWDGEWHFDEGQVNAAGDTLWHGHMVPYLVPSEGFIEYMKETCIKRVIDCGITDIFIEEPEFWAEAGYSEAFKREWEKFYGFPWRPQNDSPENAYLSNKLKYHLYYNALDEVCSFAKSYGASKDLDIKCFVATHSLVNYSQWQIVSPEASLASLPCIDGYIAQVWTGTSRVLNFYDGVRKERVFETAYFEYGAMESMVAPTGRTVYFLTDPIEDAVRDWVDYKKNYQATFTAQLLYPSIDKFEVMPWPDRIYEGLYHVGADSDEKALIPRHYSTQIQLMIGALNKMPLSRGTVSGSQGISVLMANSLMFQRAPEFEGYSDKQFSNFFGEAMSLFKKGVPVGIVHIENLGFPEALSDTRILLMSYSNMKPMDPDAHKYLASWVKRGGIIIYSGRDDDPFQSAPEWWNQNGNSYKAPSDHLFELMGIKAGAPEAIYKYGRGKVCILRHDPKEYVEAEGGDSKLMVAVRNLYGEELQFKNNFYLERGMYVIASVLEESVSVEPFTINGTLIDIYDSSLPVYESGRTLHPGEQALMIDIAKVADPQRPQVLAAASREYDEVIGRHSYSYICKSPANTTNIARVLLPKQPTSVKVDGRQVYDPASWNPASRTYLLSFENSPEGIFVEFEW